MIRRGRRSRGSLAREMGDGLGSQREVLASSSVRPLRGDALSPPPELSVRGTQ